MQARLSRVQLAGSMCIAAAVVITALTYGPVLQAELGYDVRQLARLSTEKRPITPIDRDFGVVIPKIGANAHVIANVDPYNSAAYQAALTKGVAHAKGTGIPGQPGNVFLFSHSSANFYEALQYNSIFYLLTKLDIGDQIMLYYHNERYLYVMTAKQMVKPSAVQYLNAIGNKRQTLTLMTCWPPGTSYERLLVIAELQK